MILSVAGVQFSYNGLPVLEDLTFEVKAGEVLAVLGVNGAGKSTLLKCINRILKPARGAVLVAGKDVAKMRRVEAARCFGYVPQHRTEDPIIVFDAVLLGRRPHMTWTMTRHDLEVAERVISEMGISHLAMRPVSRLSGGEAQKVLIARALAQEPDILLLDEPTSSLDVRNQLDIMRLLKGLTQTKNIVTLASIHDINLALRFADRFLILKNGVVHAAVGRHDVTPGLIREVYGIEVAIVEIAGSSVAVPIDEKQ